MIIFSYENHIINDMCKSSLEAMLEDLPSVIIEIIIIRVSYSIFNLIY